MVSLSERGLEVYETSSGRLLWKRSDGGAQIARVLATEVWLTEAGGRLVRRSLRSGRALGSVQIPQGAQVVDSFSEETPAGGTSSWTVIASRNPQASGVVYYGDPYDTMGSGTTPRGAIHCPSARTPRLNLPCGPLSGK